MNPNRNSTIGQIFLCLLFMALMAFMSCSSQSEQAGDFVCPPCNQSCDELSFKQAGTCPHCHMELMHKNELVSEELELNKVTINPGSGVFLIEGGPFRKEKSIKVFYHQPKDFSRDSPIVMVIPGAGRNADSYRNAWIDKSEQYGVLVLSPMYTEETYPFEDYHLAGLIKEANLAQSVQFSDTSNQVYLDEDSWEYTLNQDPDQWLFQDFDRIFELTKAALNSNQTQYDLFGHSAGGHILHRLALFYQSPKINRIVASNASFYTLPDDQIIFPFGLMGIDMDSAKLSQAFTNELIVFLGAKDNEHETGGSFLRSNTADQQGLHRLARGQHFFKVATLAAKENAMQFNWQLHTVPNVGHNQSLMGAAAADYLYNTN